MEVNKEGPLPESFPFSPLTRTVQIIGPEEVAQVRPKTQPLRTT